LDESKEFHVDAIPEVESAKLAMLLAERNYRRGESLKKQNAIALSDADQMETDYQSAVHRYHLAVFVAKQLYQNYRQATVHLVSLRKAVDDCTIRAPFDGWVASRDIAAGERVIAMFPGAKLVTVLRIDPLRLSLTVPQQEMSKIKIGQTVTFQTDAFPGETFTARVRYITPLVTSENRSLVVEAVAPNHDRRLLPGLFVTAELQLDKRVTDLYVPQAAVRSRGEVAAVFVLRKGVFREQIVSLGEASEGRVRVVSGLLPDDVVVTTPDKVRDGDSER
jgi:membrane fusion protein (multidrug efflux system)